MLQWTQRCGCFFQTVILFPLDVQLEVELLDHMVVLFKFFFNDFIIYFWLCGVFIAALAFL